VAHIGRLRVAHIRRLWVAYTRRLPMAQYRPVNDKIQCLILSLGSASIAIPFLLGQTTSLPQNLIATGLYFLAFVYSVIGMKYATASYYVNSESNYIHQYLGPKVNAQLNTASGYCVFQAESFNRGQRHGIIPLYLSSIGSIAVSILIVLPSFSALLATQYVFLLPTVQSPQPSPGLQFLSSALIPLAIVAWASFGFSILSQVLSMVYALVTNYVLPEDARDE
jgi:hypothetical protein